MRRNDSNASSGGRDAAPHADPVLLPPQPISPTAGAVTVIGLVALLATGLAFFGATGTNAPSAPQAGSAGNGKSGVIALSANQTQGAFRILPSAFQNSPASVLAQLNMPEAEKRRLAEKLLDGSVRLAAVTLWDRVDEDGDMVEVSAATFSQTLTIMHKPVTFFIPVQPGGVVSIRGVRDGGGGNVTLGVSTVIGPVPLPPLAPGQVVEIPAL